MIARSLVALAMFSASVSAAESDHRESVRKVQEQMKKPGFSKEAEQDSPDAARVNRQIEGLAGSQADIDAIYGLAADILGNMQDMTPEQMMKVIEEAQKDPQGFASKWTPEQRRRLKELSGRLPAAQKKNP